MKHNILIAIAGLVLFLGIGSVVLASNTNCALGPAGTPEEEGNDTKRRSDDYSWYSHFVCTAQRAQHNR